MQTKIVATPLAAEPTEATPVSRRSFLAGSGATAAVATTLAAGGISAAVPGTSEQVTPALARLLEQLRLADAERRRLTKVDDEARYIYFRTAPAIPDAIAAPRDEHGRLLGGFGEVYYAQRSRKPGHEGGAFVLRPTYWRKLGDEELARVAEDFIAADEAAKDAAGCERSTAAETAQWEIVNEIELAIERFPVRSFADLTTLALMVRAQIDRDVMSDDMPEIIIDHILRLAKSAQWAGAAASAAVPGLCAPSQASPELVDLVHRLNDAISRSNANKPRIAEAKTARVADHLLKLDDIDEAICSERGDLERKILECPIRSPADLVILAKLGEHQLAYGHQMADDTPRALADGILRLLEGRALAEFGEGECADRPIAL